MGNPNTDGEVGCLATQVPRLNINQQKQGIMATKKNLDWYFYMIEYNSKQLKEATSDEDKNYYRMCKQHFIEKVRMIKPDYPI
jgi:uncharacterized protein YbaA (DUF1428 family)